MPIFLILMLVVNTLNNEENRYESKSFSDFLNEVENGAVAKVVVKEKFIEVTKSDGQKYISYALNYPNLVDKMRENGVEIISKPKEEIGLFWSVFLSWLPILLLIGVFIFSLRQMQGGGKAMGFGKSKARLLMEQKNKVTFDDVAGVDEAKEELSEVVDFLRDPKKYQQLGGKIPKGCLLVGPPGTGKTLLARAIAGEANVAFFSISGSDFVEMFVGVGASRVRDMFEQGKRKSPCIIFIDEIDAVGRHRGGGYGGGNDEREQTLNQLLVEMDGFESNEGVILIAATNRPDVLDRALLRPGRFDRQIMVPVPDLPGREKILDVHLAKIATAPDVDVKIIARGTPGFSGADLSNLVNEAALLAARFNKKLITMRELEEAKDKVMMGPERVSMVMSKEEKELTAYHEGGHALTAIHCPASDPIHKATIIPRGRALGLVMRLPERDRLSVTREKMLADLIVAMGGRVAEEIIFGYDKVTSGASSDIQYATNLAKNMVTEWGLSDKVGPICHSNDDAAPGPFGQNSNNLSQKTSDLIDSEVKLLVENAQKDAKKILNDNIDQLHLIAKALLEHETLSGKDIKDLLAGKEIPIKYSNNKETKSKKGSINIDVDEKDNN
ncbi:MAG: ATP-dependent zinc metalloprotease FtsH [Pseudomonadota bacterium]